MPILSKTLSPYYTMRLVCVCEQKMRKKHEEIAQRKEHVFLVFWYQKRKDNHEENARKNQKREGKSKMEVKQRIV